MTIHGEIKETKVNLNQKKIILRVEISVNNLIKKAKLKKERTKSKKHIYQIIKELFKEDMKVSTLSVNY